MIANASLFQEVSLTETCQIMPVLLAKTPYIAGQPCQHYVFILGATPDDFPGFRVFDADRFTNSDMGAFFLDNTQPPTIFCFPSGVVPKWAHSVIRNHFIWIKID